MNHFLIFPTDARFEKYAEEGEPDCLCSRCRQPIGEGECALRLWPEEARFEYRYCERCQPQLFAAAAEVSAENAKPKPPGAPGFWRNETSGRLAPVVEAYLRGDPLSAHQIGVLRSYLRQWIESPAWRGPVIDGLRDAIHSLHSRAQIAHWLDRAIEAGADPF